MSVFKGLGVTFLVLLSSFFAFVGTCVPIGLATFNQAGNSLALAITAGGVAAAIVGGGVAALFIRSSRNGTGKGPSSGGDEP